MTVRRMTLHDVQMVLGWAADEGWNPGRDDARAFYASDPAGFLIKEVDGDPVAAISVVNHDSATAFLGLYLCRPSYRGQGHGLEVWRAGLAHAGSRNIGLDGVPDQQENYARSGFVKCGSTIRFEGHIDTKPAERVRPAEPSELPALIERDMKISGMHREAFATAWLSDTPTRKTIVSTDGTGVTGFATFRRCASGSKVGPLYAASKADAVALLVSNPLEPCEEPYLVDAADHGSALATLLTSLGFEPVFETARMFLGSRPQSAPVAFHAIATMELG